LAGQTLRPAVLCRFTIRHAGGHRAHGHLAQPGLIRLGSVRRGDRAMSKPPLIRAVKAKPPATLEIAWSTGEKLTVDVSLPGWRGTACRLMRRQIRLGCHVG